MATRPEPIPVSTPSEEEREYIASQWKLMWWRFIRHRLAVVATAIILLLSWISQMGLTPNGVNGRTIRKKRSKQTTICRECETIPMG